MFKAKGMNYSCKCMCVNVVVEEDPLFRDTHCIVHSSVPLSTWLNCGGVGLLGLPTTIYEQQRREIIYRLNTSSNVLCYFTRIDFQVEQKHVVFFMCKCVCV